jgi:integrase
MMQASVADATRLGYLRYHKEYVDVLGQEEPGVAPYPVTPPKMRIYIAHLVVRRDSGATAAQAQSALLWYHTAELGHPSWTEAEYNEMRLFKTGAKKERPARVVKRARIAGPGGVDSLVRAAATAPVEGPPEQRPRRRFYRRQNTAMYICQYLLGLRPSELTGLRVKDVGFDVPSLEDARRTLAVRVLVFDSKVNKQSTEPEEVGCVPGPGDDFARKSLVHFRDYHNEIKNLCGARGSAPAAGKPGALLFPRRLVSNFEETWKLWNMWTTEQYTRQLRADAGLAGLKELARYGVSRSLRRQRATDLAAAGGAEQAASMGNWSSAASAAAYIDTNSEANRRQWRRDFEDVLRRRKGPSAGRPPPATTGTFRSMPGQRAASSNSSSGSSSSGGRHGSTSKSGSSSSSSRRYGSSSGGISSSNSGRRGAGNSGSGSSGLSGSRGSGNSSGGSAPRASGGGSSSSSSGSGHSGSASRGDDGHGLVGHQQRRAQQRSSASSGVGTGPSRLMRPSHTATVIAGRTAAHDDSGCSPHRYRAPNVTSGDSLRAALAFARSARR